jgi:hypothetical protein
MAVALTINGTTYQYPVPGQDPTWGADATDWAKAVTAALATLISPGDILQTQFTINNNISVATNINGLIFDSGTVRAANIEYTIYRISIANPTGQTESGRIHLTFDDSATVGQKWVLSQFSNGTNSGVVFSIDDSTGQVQYTSSDINSIGYVGTITFAAKVLNK